MNHCHCIVLKKVYIFTLNPKIENTIQFAPIRAGIPILNPYFRLHPTISI